MLLLAFFALTSCERDYDAPPLSEPQYNGPAANTTIAQLRTMGASATEDTPYIVESEKIMKAVVTGNDESGNIYSKIFLQDETGAIEMEVAQNSVYNYYPVGQTVFVNLDGLSISVYGDEQQLGDPNGYLYRTPWETFQQKVVKSGWADASAAKPLVIDDISTINADPDKYKFRLVQFANVAFVNGGSHTFAPSSNYGEENISDSRGNTLMVRTSSYANFASKTLPTGRGNVTGILGRFRGNWQLTLRTAADVAGFTGGNGGTDNPDKPATTETLLDESFGKDSGQGKFTIEDVTLPQGSTYVWKASNYNDSYYMMASAYVGGSNQNSESRLVSPSLNLTSKNHVTLTFKHTFKTFGADTHLSDLKLEVRESGSSAWQEVSIPTYSTGKDNVFVPSGDISLDVYAGKTIQFAFHYKSTTANALRWQIQDVKVTASENGNQGTPIDPVPTTNN